MWALLIVMGLSFGQSHISFPAISQESMFIQIDATMADSKPHCVDSGNSCPNIFCNFMCNESDSFQLNETLVEIKLEKIYSKWHIDFHLDSIERPPIL